MTALAETADVARDKGGLARMRMLGRAASEYWGFVVQAQRTWLIGVAIGVGAAWLNVLPGISIPGWIVAAIIMATMVAVQFQAFYRVREEREAFSRAQAVNAAIDEIAALRTKETELRNRVVRDMRAYVDWKTEFMELRSAIHDRIARGISKAEAETFNTIGNLKHIANGGIHEEHNALLAVATRDIDHLADLIHGHSRFKD